MAGPWWRKRIFNGWIFFNGFADSFFDLLPLFMFIYVVLHDFLKYTIIHIHHVPHVVSLLIPRIGSDLAVWGTVQLVRDTVCTVDALQNPPATGGSGGERSRCTKSPSGRRSFDTGEGISLDFQAHKTSIIRIKNLHWSHDRRWPDLAALHSPRSTFRAWPQARRLLQATQQAGGRGRTSESWGRTPWVLLKEK